MSSSPPMPHRQQRLAYLESSSAGRGHGRALRWRQHRRAWVQINGATISRDRRDGPEFASVFVELTSPETRDVTLAAFLEHWQSSIPESPLVEQLQIEQGDQPWPEIELTFSGDDTTALKGAADDLAAVMRSMPGVNNVHDDLPYGRDQWVFQLTPEGRALGLTATEVGRQVRTAFEGSACSCLPRAMRSWRCAYPCRARIDIA
jgi:multidrug efflux pump subunit AcrB